jgi:hypothetical protein
MSTRNDYPENFHHPLCMKYISGDDLPCICDLLDEHATLIRADEREKAITPGGSPLGMYSREAVSLAHAAAVHMDEMDNMGADLLAAVRDLDAMRMQRDAARADLATLRTQIAADIEERCDKLAHRERIATPPEWPVCAKCMPYFNIARGDAS